MVATLESIAEQIKTGALEQAEASLASVPMTEENKAQVSYLRGALMEARDDAISAIEAYQDAVEEDSNHRQAAFHAALVLDRAGDDEAAIE